jgi:NAD+ kinase
MEVWINSMRKFGLITNAYKDKGLMLTYKIADYIRNKGGEAVCISERNGIILDYEQMDYSDIPEGLDCIMVLGGDGTLIRVATGSRKSHVPLIGVNLGTLGYLCELEEETVFTAIDSLMNGEYKIDERMMLQGKRTGEEHGKSALNDVVIHRSGNLSLLSLLVYVNGEFLTTYDADGVIISTPTGSTGYNLSAGGAIVTPEAQLILITPICPHSLSSREIVASAEDEITVEIRQGRRGPEVGAVVTFDGREALELNTNDKIVVKRSGHTTKLVQLDDRTFFEVLRSKLGAVGQ